MYNNSGPPDLDRNYFVPQHVSFDRTILLLLLLSSLLNPKSQIGVISIDENHNNNVSLVLP